MKKNCTFTLLLAELCVHCPLLLLLLLLIYSRLLVIRWRSSGKSNLSNRSKRFTPALYKCCVQCSLVWSCVVLLQTG